MTVTAEDLKKALSPMADTQKEVEEATTSVIDVGKVAEVLLAESAKAIGGDDAGAETRLDELTKKVDAIDELLEKAVEAEDGRVLVLTTKNDPLATEFAAPNIEVGKGSAADGAATPPGDGADTGSGEGDGAGSETDVNKGAEEDDSWPEDMAPSSSPVRKSDRLTDREKPVSTDPSERQRTKLEKRDRAEAVRKGRSRRRSTT